MNKDITVVMKSAKPRGRGIKMEYDKGGQLKETSSFKYLGTKISVSGGCVYKQWKIE